MSNQSILRITRELGEIQRGSDLSLAVAYRDVDVRNVRALIIGPPDTPYEFGFFEFSVKFNKEYPTKAPAVLAITTNGGRTRFNPNIYSQGKVCLSILGTWRGEPGEEWSSAQGLESILISIQSLMSTNPYENEPGFEDAHTPSDKKNQEAYVAKIRHETLRISIIERLEGYMGISKSGTIQPVTVYNAEDEFDAAGPDARFEPFKDLFKRRFLWYFDSYKASIDSEMNKHKDGEKFTKMPFEGPGNIMDGTFQYSKLKTRLETIRQKIDEETASWIERGRLATRDDVGIASNLQRQFEQVSAYFSQSDTVSLDLNLVKKNPFLWELTLFGRTLTKLEGGIFTFKIYLSPEFPEVLPRVKCETKLFHHRISEDGVVCYDCQRKDDMKSHVEGIVSYIEEESPPYDPRLLVNPTAAKLFWGDERQRKLYNRTLRRSVEQSSEC